MGWVSGCGVVLWRVEIGGLFKIIKKPIICAVSGVCCGVLCIWWCGVLRGVISIGHWEALRSGGEVILRDVKIVNVVVVVLGWCVVQCAWGGGAIRNGGEGEGGEWGVAMRLGEWGWGGCGGRRLVVVVLVLIVLLLLFFFFPLWF